MSVLSWKNLLWDLIHEKEKSRYFWSNSLIALKKKHVIKLYFCIEQGKVYGEKSDNSIKKIRKLLPLSHVFTNDIVIMLKKGAGLQGEISSKLISRMEREKREWTDFHANGFYTEPR